MAHVASQGFFFESELGLPKSSHEPGLGLGFGA